MAAVWIRLRAELRSRWRAWLALAVLAGLAGGLVIAIAAGARRTDSAVARWRAATETMDVWVGKSKVYALERTSRASSGCRRSRDAVRSADLAFWGRTDAGRPVTVNEVELNAPVEGRDCCANRPKLLAGRPPDPAGPTRSSSTPRRPSTSTCGSGARCGRGSRRRASWRGSSRPASTTPAPTPRPRAAGRCSACASSGFAPSSLSEDAFR